MRTYKKRTIRWNIDFDPIIERFEEMIKKDDKLTEKIPENKIKQVIKSGLFSHAVRQLIKRYVDGGWEFFVAKHKRGLKDESNKTFD